jgi:hypothetical protein
MIDRVEIVLTVRSAMPLQINRGPSMTYQKPRTRLLEDREGQEDTRSVSRGAFHLYVSAMVSDDLMRDGKAQPCPLRFCGEEGLKDAIQMLFGDSCAFVFDHHSQDPLIGLDQESNFLPVRGGVERILEQVCKGLTNLLSI